MAAVWREDRLAAEESPYDRKRDVDSGRESAIRGAVMPSSVADFWRPDDSVAAENEADQQAAGIAQEDRRGIEVIAEESKQAAGERQGRHRQRRVMAEERGNENRQVENRPTPQRGRPCHRRD